MRQSPFSPPLYHRANASRTSAPLPVMEPRNLPAELEALAQQVLGREEDDFHWTVEDLAVKLLGELRDIYLQTDAEGGWFTSPLYIRRNLRGPLEAAGLIEFQAIPGSRIEHLVRVAPAGSALLGKPHPITRENPMLAIETTIVETTEGRQIHLIPGVDFTPVEQEIEPIIIGESAHIYVPCQSCGQTYVNRWAVGLWEQFGTRALYKWSLSPDMYRLCPACQPAPLTDPIGRVMEAHAAELAQSSNNSNSALDEDTQPLEVPVRPPKFDSARFFNLLDQQLGDAFMALEQDRMVIARGHRDAIETIKRYVVHMQEQTGFYEYQIDQMRQGYERLKEISDWWKRQAESYQAAADRHAANIVKMADTPAQAADPGLPRLSLVDVETLTDLARKHCSIHLENLLDMLHLPELSEFRTSYPVLHEAKAAIGKRIVDYGYSVIAHHVACNRSRGGKPYLTLDFGFGTVNIFDRSIKEHFVKYPGGYDEWLTEGFELELDPPVRVVMSRDSKNYARLDDLYVVE